jgi:Flp pilus assembly protein TadG
MRKTFLQDERGQMLLLFALVVPLLILFAAMSIDMGLIYDTKAQLSNSVDAAVLTGAKNYSMGVATAQALATDMFNANFANKPATLVYTWCPTSAGCTGATVSLTLKATTTVNTTFMSYLPRFAQWSLSDTGAATRSTLVMSLVLDRSGSMLGDGGGAALKNAVPLFVDDFTTADYIGMVSFASHATIDVPVTTNYNSAIKTAVAAFSFVGGTFGGGSGTNPSYSAANSPPLSMADSQNNSIVLAAGDPETKVVVYFTDGLMNTIQDKLPCTNLGPTLYNYGGYDPPQTIVAALDPASETQWGNIPVGGPPPYSAGSCNGVAKFRSQQTGTPMLDFTRANVTGETQWRALYTGNAMRGESPIQTYIYIIGLSSAVTGPGVEAFLSTLANDPDAIAKYGGGPFNSSQPAGLFLEVPNCPSPTCTTDLNIAFQTIASRIQLRLSR